MLALLLLTFAKSLPELLLLTRDLQELLPLIEKFSSDQLCCTVLVLFLSIHVPISISLSDQTISSTFPKKSKSLNFWKQRYIIQQYTVECRSLRQCARQSDTPYLCHFSTQMAEIWSPGTFFSKMFWHTKYQLSLLLSDLLYKAFSGGFFSDIH